MISQLILNAPQNRAAAGPTCEELCARCRGEARSVVVVVVVVRRGVCLVAAGWSMCGR